MLPGQRERLNVAVALHGLDDAFLDAPEKEVILKRCEKFFIEIETELVK